MEGLCALGFARCLAECPLSLADPSQKPTLANGAGQAQQNHFLVVEIDGKTMRVTPVGYEEIAVRDASGSSITMPLTISLP